MQPGRRSKAGLALAAAAALLVPLGGPAQASHPLGIHWLKRGANAPVTVFLVDRTRGRYPVAQAAAQWNRTAVIKFVAASSCPAYRGCTTVEIKDTAGSQGLTWLYSRGGHLTGSRVLLTSRTLTAAQRLTVTCHELGHALGLDHRRVGANSCLTPASRVLRPDTHDFAQLSQIYGHAH